MVGRVLAFEAQHFGRDVGGSTLQVAIAPDRLRTPVAAERATARCRHVEAEVAVRAAPYGTIGVDVDEVASGQASAARAPAAEQPALERNVSPVDRRADVGQPRDEPRNRQRDVVGEPVHERHQRRKPLAEQHGIGAGREIAVGRIRGIGACGDDAGAARTRGSRSSRSTHRASSRGTSCSGSCSCPRRTRRPAAAPRAAWRGSPRCPAASMASKNGDARGPRRAAARPPAASRAADRASRVPAASRRSAGNRSGIRVSTATGTPRRHEALDLCSCRGRLWFYAPTATRARGHAQRSAGTACTRPTGKQAFWAAAWIPRGRSATPPIARTSASSSSSRDSQSRS